jgi:amino acid transporter
MAALIVLGFMQCALIYPEVGGTYAYVRHAFGPAAGYTAGWALLLGEAVLLPIFPTAFVNYLGYFIPSLSDTERMATGLILLGVVTGINIWGVRASGRLNDILTLTKLIPLLILIGAGLAAAVVHPELLAVRVQPFAPLGWGGFGPALILIFLAYAGFELAVLPASEVQNPHRVIPRGLLTAVTIATLVYMLTAFATTVALPWRDAAASQRPLADALSALSGEFGLGHLPAGVLMSLGGLISIAAAFDVYTLGVARLSYAMAVDGFLPRPLGWVHPRFRTPAAALLIQALFGFIVGRLLDLTHLIDAGMFLIGLCYTATSLAAIRLIAQHPEQRLHIPGLPIWLALGSLAGLYLACQAPNQLKLIGLAGVAIGLVAHSAVSRTIWYTRS